MLFKICAACNELEEFDQIKELDIAIYKLSGWRKHKY